ncbi:MAG: gamma-type small acid-soluble spore protein [Hydrogenibacillus schlegelii]|nr:gamma-type small acid-soluble spore protein [Hydrogenibacillus schlegelii]
MDQKTKAGTNVEHVKKRNQAAKGNQAGGYGSEFAAETNVADVKAENKRSMQNKKS